MANKEDIEEDHFISDSKVHCDYNMVIATKSS